MQTQTLPLTPTLLATPHRFLLHTPTNTAILSDLHLGIEHTMRQQGLAFPNINEQKIRESWNYLCDRLGDRGHIVIAGDLFDSPTPDPASLTLARELINTLPPHITVTITPGNHDPDPTTLRTLLANTRAKISTCETLPDPAGDHLIFHGHDWPTTLAEGRAIAAEGGANLGQSRSSLGQPRPITTLIVGHQHPAVTLRSRLQSAKMICYALCQLSPQSSVLGGGSTLIILPTFSQAPIGTNLMTDHHWILDCPQPPADQIQIAGIVPNKDGGAVLNFGPLAQLPF